MQVNITDRAEKELLKLPPQIKDRILERLELWEKNYTQMRIKKLIDRDDEWELRVGDYRVIMELDHNRGIANVLHFKKREIAFKKRRMGK